MIGKRLIASDSNCETRLIDSNTAKRVYRVDN
jgi:hypothetical protein